MWSDSEAFQTHSNFLEGVNLIGIDWFLCFLNLRPESANYRPALSQIKSAMASACKLRMFVEKSVRNRFDDT